MIAMVLRPESGLSVMVIAKAPLVKPRKPTSSTISQVTSSWFSGANAQMLC